MRAAGQESELLHGPIHEVRVTIAMASTSQLKSSALKFTRWVTASPGTPRTPNRIRQTARQTWELCCEKLRSGEYDILVFDELVYVLSYDMLARR